MIQTFQVTSEPVKILSVEKRRWLVFKNTSDATIYLKFDNSATELTSANGYPLAANETFALHDDGAAASDGAFSDFSNEVWAMHTDVGTKPLRIQAQ